MSAAGVSLDQGLTTARRPLADVINAARASAERTIGLIDATKFGRSSLLAIARAQELDAIVTDAELPAEVAEDTGPQACGSRSPTHSRRAHESTRHPVHRPVGRSAARRSGRQDGRVGLRRARAGLLGRSLRRRRRGARPRLRRRAAQAARAARARRVGDRQPPRRPVRVRPDRRPPPGRARRRGVGRRRSRGRAAARRRADEGHGARRGAARRRGRHRLHRLAGLAPPLLLPAQRLERRRGRLPGVRGALGADHRRVRRRGRAVRARGAPDRDRLRLRHDAQDAGRDRQPRGLRHQLRPEPLRAPVPRLGGVHHRVRRPHLPRAHQGLQAPARRPHLDPRRAPRLRPAGPRLGLRLARARRRRLRGDDPRAQPDRLRRPAVDRVGGLRDGPRLGRARRARVRAPHRLRPVLGRLRRRVRKGAADVQGRLRDDGRRPQRRRRAADRRRHARLRVHGQGPLERVQDARLHDLAAAADARAGGDRGAQRGGGRGGRAPLRVRGATRRTGRRSSRDDRVQLFDNAGPEQPARGADDRRRRGGQARDLREAAGPRRRRVVRDLAARRGRGRQAHVRLQLPLRAGRAAGARRSSSRASWARSSTSAAPTCRSGARPRARSGASRRRRPARARSATSART